MHSPNPTGFKNLSGFVFYSVFRKSFTFYISEQDLKINQIIFEYIWIPKSAKNKIMKLHFITTLLIILPFFASAQVYNQRMQMNQQMNAQNQKWASERDRADRQWSQQAMFNRLQNKNSKTQKALDNEEKNKEKLEEKTTKLNADLKKQQDQLTTLENSPNNANSDVQKNIQKTKEQIAKSEEKLNKAKTELETSSKKVESLKKEMEISLTKKADLEKKEKEEAERKKKQEEINQALLKSVK